MAREPEVLWLFLLLAAVGKVGPLHVEVLPNRQMREAGMAGAEEAVMASIMV